MACTPQDGLASSSCNHFFFPCFACKITFNVLQWLTKEIRWKTIKIGSSFSEVKARTKTMILSGWWQMISSSSSCCCWYCARCAPAGAWLGRVSACVLVITAACLGWVAWPSGTRSGWAGATWWHVTWATRGSSTRWHLATGHCSSWGWVTSWTRLPRLFLICQPLEVTFSCNLGLIMNDY